MKKLHIFYLCLCLFGANFSANSVLFAKNPTNLYEQLCAVNQEWHKNKAIAEALGFTNQPIIQNEQDLLGFHLEILEKIFSGKINISNLSNTSKIDENNLSEDLSFLQKENRKRHLEVLNEYWNLKNCPKNTFLNYRNPVFIDAQNRHCAVAFLMQKDGKTTFCKKVQQNSNFIFVREINNAEFATWQLQSGLSIDELAWIQPGYSVEMQYTPWNNARNPDKFVALDTNITKKIVSIRTNSPSYEHYMNVFMRQPYSQEIIETKTKTKNVDWSILKVNNETHQKAVTAYKMFQNELYIALGTYYNDTLKADKAEIWKWTAQKKWQKVIDLSAKQGQVFCFFETSGQLYMGGGITSWSNNNEYKSLLIRYNGKVCKDISPKYNRIITDLYVYKNIPYLETVIVGQGN